MSTRKVYIAIGIDPDNDIICTDIAEEAPTEAIDSIESSYDRVEILKVLELTVPATYVKKNPSAVKLDLTK